MTTQLTLTIPDDLSTQETEQLRQLFYDAFGEFIAARGPTTETYVKRRYKLVGKQYTQKLVEVEGRKALAARIKLAASTIDVHKHGSSLLDELMVALEAKPDAVSPTEAVEFSQDLVDALCRSDDDDESPNDPNDTCLDCGATHPHHCPASEPVSKAE